MTLNLEDLPLPTKKIILAKAAYSIYVSRITMISALALMYWDWIVSLDREIQYMWTKKWTHITFLYAFNRYYGLAIMTAAVALLLNPTPTDEFCVFMFRFEGWTTFVAVCLIEGILAIRVYAFYKGNRLVLGFLLFAMFASWLSKGFIEGFDLAVFGATGIVIPGIPFYACHPFNTQSYYFAIWLPGLCFDTICFLLVAAKGLSKSHTKFSSNIGMRLLDVFKRDSVMYFVVVVICELTASIMWVRGPEQLLQVVVGYVIGIPGVMCSHLMLNLREAHHGSEVVTNNTLKSRTTWTISMPRGQPSEPCATMTNSEGWAMKSVVLEGHEVSDPDLYDEPLEHLPEHRKV